MFGKKISDEHKQFLLGLSIGRVHSADARAKMSRSRKGKMCGESNPFYGMRHDAETREKMSRAKDGMYLGAKNPNAKRVVQYSLDGKKVNEYETLTAAIKSFNPPANNIGDCCRGKTRQAHGYIWQYKEEAIT